MDNIKENFKSACEALFGGVSLAGTPSQMVYCKFVSGESGYIGFVQIKYKIPKSKLMEYFGDHATVRCLAKSDVTRGKAAVDALKTDGDGKEVWGFGEFYRQGGLKR